MAAIERAYLLAECALATCLPARWSHVRGVASLAQLVGDSLSGVNLTALMQAAWLHDIGYSPEISRIGFHPLDGASYLADKGFDVEVVALVAHHSGAAIEARLRGINGLEAYPNEVSITRDVLWYCDASTGPRGQRLSPAERWREVRQRYGTNSVVSHFLNEAEPVLCAAVERVEHEMLRKGVDYAGER